MWVFLGRDTHGARPDALAGGSECLTVKNFTRQNATTCVNQHRQVTETTVKPGLKRKEQIYFMTSLTWRILKQHLGRDTGVGTPSVISSVCSVTSELSSLSQNRELRRVHESASKSLQTVMLSLHRDFTSQHRQRTNSSRRKGVGFPTPVFFRPWCSQLQGHLRKSTPSSPIFFF